MTVPANQEVERHLNAFQALTGLHAYMVSDEGNVLARGERTLAPCCMGCVAGELPSCFAKLRETDLGASCAGGRLFVRAPLPGARAALLLGPGASPSHLSHFHILLSASAAQLRNGLLLEGDDDLFGRLSAYIHAHLQEDLSPKALQEALYVSFNALQRAARRATGLSLGAYVRQARLEYAKDMLYQTRLSITEVAERSGISDFNYFSRVFKARFALSPRAYRKSKR